MPISSLLLVAACSSGQVQEQAEEGAIVVECAVGPDSELAADCLVEMAGDVWILRHPDGSFRRVEREGDSYVAADGAREALVMRRGDEVQLSIDGDRYRWTEGQFNAR